MQAAIRSGARRDNPAAGHHVPVRRRRIRQGDVLTMSEVHALIDQVRDPYKPAVWLLVLTGMRPAELCGLRVRSIDFVRNLVSITETLLPVSAYADQRLELVSGPPKTEAGDRTIPIPGWLCDQLAGMLAARAAQRGTQIEPAEPLFVNRVGKPLNRDKFRETVIRPALIAAGLPPATRTYDLRHAARVDADRPGRQRARRGATDGSLRRHRDLARVRPSLRRRPGTAERAARRVAGQVRPNHSR